jgi:hypothetical protein
LYFHSIITCAAIFLSIMASIGILSSPSLMGKLFHSVYDLFYNLFFFIINL